MLQRKPNGQISPEMAELLAQIEALKAENARLAQAKARPLTMKVSEKGAVSLYGMGRFPLTMYAQQWEKVLDMGDSIREFIAANKASLSTK